MFPNGFICILTLGLYLSLWHCAGDLCNWTGSGIARDEDSRTVLQVRLRCTAGSVQWVYPGQALRVVLEPNLSYAHPTTACIKPFRAFRGVSVYVERGGGLELLITQDSRPEQVFCFRADGPRKPVLYLQANPHGGVGRHVAGFRYELFGNRSSVPSQSVNNSCRPCSDGELLMAVCNSDFVVRGHIKKVSHDQKRQASLVEVAGGRVYRQCSGMFERKPQTPEGAYRPASSWQGHIHTLLRCRVQSGDGEFLFTGSEHFGEAWLGCAPRYRDFVSLYLTARAAHLNPCDFPLD